MKFSSDEKIEYRQTTFSRKREAGNILIFMETAVMYRSVPAGASRSDGKPS
jgi:hypothetical protein